MKIRFVAFLSLFMLISAFTLSAQKFKNEFGFLGGTSYYLGDINHLRQFYKAKPAYGLMYRHTFNDYIALKTQALRLGLSADDADFNNEYQQLRAASFDTHLIEAAGLFEFNFLPYNPPKRLKFSPYVTAGIGMAFADNLELSNYFLALPIGGGAKIALGKRISMNIAWVYRNTGSDNLDDLPLVLTSETRPLYSSKQMTKINTNDWYSTLTISLSFNFSGTKGWCPAYMKNKKKFN